MVDSVLTSSFIVGLLFIGVGMIGAIYTLFQFIGEYKALSKQVALAEKEENFNEAMISSSEEKNKSVQRTGKWTESEVLVAAYIAENYRMTNDDLLEDISNMLNRSKSALVRKINRLRAVHTCKAPFATELDRSSAVTMKMRNKGYTKSIFIDALRDLKADIYGLDELLYNSKKINNLETA